MWREVNPDPSAVGAQGEAGGRGGIGGPARGQREPGPGGQRGSGGPARPRGAEGERGPGPAPGGSRVHGPARTALEEAGEEAQHQADHGGTALKGAALPPPAERWCRDPGSRRGRLEGGAAPVPMATSGA